MHPVEQCGGLQVGHAHALSREQSPLADELRRNSGRGPFTAGRQRDQAQDPRQLLGVDGPSHIPGHVVGCFGSSTMELLEERVSRAVHLVRSQILVIAIPQQFPRVSELWRALPQVVGAPFPTAVLESSGLQARATRQQC